MAMRQACSLTIVYYGPAKVATWEGRLIKFSLSSSRKKDENRGMTHEGTLRLSEME